MRSRAGATLIEVVVGFGLLSLLLVIMFASFRMGAGAWKKGETQTRLLQDAKIVAARLSRAVERSTFSSAAVDPGPDQGTAVSMMSGWDEANKRYDYDPLVGSPVWHEHVVCYYDAQEQTVRWKELPLGSPTTAPAPLADLAAERTGGRLLARNVTRCDFTLLDSTLEFTIELEERRYGSEEPEKVELPVKVMFRN